MTSAKLPGLFGEQSSKRGNAQALKIFSGAPIWDDPHEITNPYSLRKVTQQILVCRDGTDKAKGAL